MDPAKPSSAPKKVRFAPKRPPRSRRAQPVEPKTEAAKEDANDEEAQALLRRLNERLGKRGPKVEKKSSVRVAFEHGAVSSTSIRTYGKPREANGDKQNGSNLKDSAGQIVVSSPPTGRTDEASGSSLNALIASSQKTKKPYIEPWDYHRTYYPTILPLRRPYSGDPELLDEEEFGEAVAKLEYDENTTNSASEIGLLEENEDVQMLFFQLPSNLPLDKQVARAHREWTAEDSNLSLNRSASANEKGKEKVGSSISSRDAVVPASAKGKEIVGNSISSGRANASVKGCSLEDLPGGYMGKMLVYKSGAIKLKLGENLYDVSPGSDCIFAQDVVAINTVDKNCCLLGELGKRAVVTPDIDSFLDNVINLR